MRHGLPYCRVIDWQRLRRVWFQWMRHPFNRWSNVSDGWSARSRITYSQTFLFITTFVPMLGRYKMLSVSFEFTEGNWTEVASELFRCISMILFGRCFLIVIVMMLIIGWEFIVNGFLVLIFMFNHGWSRTELRLFGTDHSQLVSILLFLIRI